MAGEAALIPLLLQERDRMERRMRPVRRTVGILFLAGAGGFAFWTLLKRMQAKAEVAKIATDKNAQVAALYLEAVKPPGLLMRLIAMSPAGLLVNAIDSVTGWFSASDNEKILLITDRVWDWSATVKSYARMTGGRGLDRDIRKKMGSEYPKFVDRLARNSRAADTQQREKENQAGTATTRNVFRAKIMGKGRNKIVKFRTGTGYDSKPVKALNAAKLWTVQTATTPPKRKMVGKADPNTFLGTNTGRFLNWNDQECLVEVLTSKGNVWVEFNDLTFN